MENADSDEGGEKKTTIDAGKEAAIEAEVQAARQRAVVPLEIRMKQFRDMLAEKEVIHIYLRVFYSSERLITERNCIDKYIVDFLTWFCVWFWSEREVTERNTQISTL